MITENPPDENRSYFPAWSDILDSIYTCQTARVEQGVPWTKDELGLLKDCRNYSQFCREKIFGSWKPPPTVRRNNVHLKGFKGLKSEKQVEYAEMFDTLLKKDGAGEMPFAMKVASSFPLLCGKRELLRKHESENVPIRHTGSPDGLGQGKHGKSPRKAVDDQNPEYPILHNQLKLAKQRGVSCEKVSMFYQNVKEEPVSTTESTSNDIHSDTQANERSRSSSVDSESSQSERRSQFVHYSFPECYFTRKSPLLCSQLWNEAVIPNSLRRLVELCSRIVETEPAVLFTAVEKLERNLFDEINE